MRGTAYYCTVEELQKRGRDDIPEQFRSNTHLIYSSPATLAFNSPGAEGFGVKRAGLAIPDSIMLIVRKVRKQNNGIHIRPFRRQTGGAEKSLESFSHGLQLCSDGNRRQTGPSRKKNSAIRSGLAEGDVLCRFYFHGLLSRLRFFHSVQQTVRIIRQQKQRRRTIRFAVEAVQDREQSPIRFKRIGELPHKTIHRLEAHKCETGRNAFKIHVLPRKCAYSKRRTIKSD